MKRLLTLIFTAIMLVFTCIFFPMPYSSADAIISGTSGNKFVLTGLIKNGPKHYFTDNENHSTLVNTTLEDNGGEYYSLELEGDNASGWGEFAPTPDIVELIKSGVVYIKLSARVESRKSSNVTFNLSYGEEQTSISSSGSGNIETSLLHISQPNQNIRYSFSGEGDGSCIIFEPTLNIYTQIDSITLLNENRIVAPGSHIKINAYNAVTSITTENNGNFLTFSKKNHQICFEFSKGENYVDVVGLNFELKDNIPDGEEIVFRAYCKSTSFNDEKIYSDYVTFKVSTSQHELKVRKDFADPGTFIGEGLYDLDTKIVTLSVEPHSGYSFVGWFIDGELYSQKTKTTLKFDIKQDIYAKFIKDITISSISVKSRVYDGTNFIDPKDVTFNFNGKEKGHDLTVEGVTFAYAGSDASDSKLIMTDAENAVLTGKDSEIYNLTSKNIPTSYGTIFKRDAFLTVEPVSKQYRERDPEITYTAQNLVQNETLSGKLNRRPGEDIGQYPITSGNLPESNPNYNIVFTKDEYFTIGQRELTLENVYVEEKQYDGNADAKIIAFLNNIYNNEDVQVELSGRFANANAGYSIEVQITNAKLVGSDKSHYTLKKYDQKLYGNILSKEVLVIAEDESYVYGDEIKLGYRTEGLIAGDTLQGELSIDSKSVGDHEIKIGSLSNPNYIISFKSATCSISPKTIKVYADQGQHKVYGDEDLPLTYSAPELISGDVLDGTLSRVLGDDVGFYDILIGTLRNENYQLEFVGAIYEILCREIDVEIEFVDKVYDGSTKVKYNVVWNNNILNADFVLNLDATLSGKDKGRQSVIVSDAWVEGESLRNYLFKYDYKNTDVNIFEREALLFVLNNSKVYGEANSEYLYNLSNVLDGDDISITIKRRPGETVGSYPFEMIYDANGNYNITLITENFVITPKTLEITLSNNEKFYGDEDPQMTFALADISQLCFNDSAEGLLDGTITRALGEEVGMYKVDLTKISSNSNYIFVVKDGIGFLINKRPVVVTLHDATKIYGEDDPNYHYSVENTVHGEDVSLQIDRRDKGEDVGEYELYCLNNSDDKYTFTVSTAFLNILPSPITVKADEKVKIYGEEDPIQSVIITKGVLKFNDRLATIQQGHLSREGDENVGTHLITQGTFSLGDNYALTFENGELHIIEREITISVLQTMKFYGDSDPSFEIEITYGKLYFNDEISGFAEREPGEEVGFYPLTEGSLSINDNYVITFVTHDLEIKPRPIEIVPVNTSKIYGEEDQDIGYTIKGDLIAEDKLEGEVYRDRSAVDSERAGSYKIYCTLNNDNYDVIFGNYYYVIERRPIVIKINSYSIDYGQSDPKFEYQMISGQILDGDNLEGGLYRSGDNSAGKYEIKSTLTLGVNYQIEFLKGYLTINPLPLKISSPSYQKIYGQIDPVFEYEISEGKLINNDKLLGMITREAGEDAGVYNLVCGLDNPNYALDFDGGTLTISPKEISIATMIYDKIYDGTTTAELRKPYLVGVIDNEVYLDYDRLNCADFETAEVGNGIKVKLHDIKIVGDKAHNYKLTLPTDIYGNITYKTMTDGNLELSAEEAVLFAHYKFKGECIAEDKVKIGRHITLATITTELSSDGAVVKPESQFTLTISLGQIASQHSNFYVYIRDANGNFKLVSSRLEGNKLIINTDEMGKFYLVTDDELWIEYALLASICVICFVALAFTMILVFKKVKSRKKKNNS